MPDGVPANVPVSVPKKKGFPRSFGRYILEKSLSRGGMGEVFLALPKGVPARCVIKTIRSDLTGDKEFIGRFADEAKIMTRTVHGNIIRIFDCGKVGSEYYIAMEFIWGRDLGDVLDRAYERGEPMAKGIGLHICRSILGGLDYIHNATAKDGRPMNLVHRDISPQNVLIGFDGQIKLIDFGLARTELLPARTQGALAVGKYGYMSPEQARHEKIDGRADLYSLGVMLFEVFTGDRLVDEQDQATLWARVLNPKHRKPTNVVPDLPSEFDDLIMSAVAVRPEDRFKNALAMREFVDNMRTPAARTKELTEYLRYLYPNADFNPPPIPELDVEEPPQVDSEYSMVIAMSEDGARSVFGRGVLPVSWTTQVNMADLLPELERRHKRKLAAERRSMEDAGIDQTIHDVPPLASADVLVARQTGAGFVSDPSVRTLGEVDDAPTTIAQAEGPRPADILSDHEETAYSRPPIPGELSSGAQVDDKFRDDEMTVMMDAPPQHRHSPWAGDSLDSKELHAATQIAEAATAADATLSEEDNRTPTPPPSSPRRSQPAAAASTAAAAGGGGPRLIKERRAKAPRRDDRGDAAPAAVLRKTVGRDKAPAKRPAYLEAPAETEEIAEVQPQLAPSWLLLILILLGITIIILLIVLLMQR